jgi:peroxiredoxin
MVRRTGTLMLKLKAVYISAFVTFVLVASGYSGWRALQGPWLPWVGALLTTLPSALFFVRIYTIGGVARTSPRMSGYIAVAVLGVTVAAGSYLVGAGEQGALLLAVCGLTSVVVYTYWYSNLPRTENRALATGQRLPSFELETEDGRKVDSRLFLGKPLLLLFYRGNWCPLCTAQIREVAAQYRELDARGIQVVLASPQPHRYTRRLAAKHEVPFHFLVDADHKASKRLGIFAKDGLPAGLQVLGYSSDTVWPTVIMTDADGTILFADLPDNYRVRPEPETFLAVFEGRLPMPTTA